MTRGWTREGGGCGHTDVATVTALRERWGLEGSRLEKEDDVQRIQMRPRSLLVDPVSYPITTAARGRRERGARGCRGLGVGVVQRIQNAKAEYSDVCLNLSERCST